MPRAVRARAESKREVNESMSKKYIYYFSEGNEAFGGDKTTMKNILGGKGSSVWAEMTRSRHAGAPGLHHHHPRPAPSTMPTAVRSTTRSPLTSSSTSRAWRRSPARPSATTPTPCWCRSVRGARQSMPGMMDTILNLGLNDEARGGSGQEDKQPPALPTTATAVSSRCSRTWS